MCWLISIVSSNLWTIDSRRLLDTMQITKYDKDNLEGMLLNAIIQVRQLLNSRPDVSAVMDDLTALKNLRGGPADATAFHDFHVLAMAFESVWMHAFDENLRTSVQALYAETVRLYADQGLVVPNFDAINDINDLNNFINEVKKVIDPKFAGSVSPPPPAEVIRHLPKQRALGICSANFSRSILTYICN